MTYPDPVLDRLAAAEGYEADDIDALLDAHQGDGGTCTGCGQTWPCDTLRDVAAGRLP